MAYVLTAALHTWFSGAATLRAMETTVADKVGDVLNNVQKQTYSLIAGEFPKFIPVTFFEATKTRNVVFEEEMIDAISESRQYYFRGVTARHVPIWLERANTKELQVSVFVLDPNCNDYLELYIREKHDESNNLSSEQILTEIEKVQRQIYYSLVGLFDARKLHPITIKLHRGPIFFRSEVFDKKCFVSLYVDAIGTNYPTTYLYNERSVFYQTFRKDITHCQQLASPSISLTSGTNEEELIGFLTKIGFSGSIEELRQEFIGFKEAFSQTSG
ncbi:MAG: hypothetical protein AAF296_05775 [Pseudomonadota bacterium]